MFRRASALSLALLFVLPLLCGGCKKKKTSPAPTSAVKREPWPAISLDVAGLDKSKLDKTRPGKDAKTAKVVYDPSIATAEAIARASTNAGYPATPAGQGS